MKKIGFWNKWKKLIMCIAVVMAVLAVSRAVPVYANDFTTAVTLPTNGKWSEKKLLAKDATDYYKFTIATAGEIDIKLMAYVSYVECILYDSNFDRINSVKSYSGSETSPNTESRVQWLSQGTYYVSVSAEKEGNYRLYASFSTSGITAAEKDSYDLPQVMSVNSKVTGVMTNSNKEDWYKVRISSAGKYNHIFQTFNNTMTAYLYDVNLSKLSELYCLYSDMETREIELKPGTYYIKIEGRYGGRYTYRFNEAIPAKGDILIDSKNQAQYKVTKAGKSGGTVTYQKSTNSMKTSITVPPTVKIDNITYKVTGIASDVFKWNSMLRKVTIGKNVSSIGKRAFYKCSNLKTITIKTNKLIASKTGADAFKDIHKKVTIKVPKKKYSAYKKMLKKKGVGKGAVYKKLS